MNKDRKTSPEAAAHVSYRSGAAARLSGVPVETLRVWERRYSVTDPSRSTHGQRQYSFEDVRRLGLIKQLVDAGNAIGALAHLDLQQLVTMLGAAAKLPITQAQANRSASDGLLKLALVGAMLRQPLIDLDPSQSKLSLVQTASTLKQAGTQFSGLKVDVMVVEQGELTLPEEQIPLLKLAQQTCQATAVLILYRFAASDAIRQLRLAGFDVARIPIDMLEFDHLCRAAVARALTKAEQKDGRGQAIKSSKKMTVAEPKTPRSTIPDRLIDDDNLMQIAKSSASIHCECPRHLVDLLQMLNSFERYSAQCENRNQSDANLHRDLHTTAAHARSSLEQALIRVARAEGIEYSR